MNKIFHLDCLKGMTLLADNSVDCCVTSPPYYGLRDYGTAVWIGGDPACDHRRNSKNANPDWKIQTRGKVDNGVGDEIYKDVCSKCGAKREDVQIGLEQTPEAYVEKLTELFLEVKRVLKKEGTLFLNLGDSYFGSGKGGHSEKMKSKNWQPVYPLNVGHAIPCDISDKEPVNYQDRDCLCGSLCGVCRKAYRIGKSHKDSLHDSMPVVSPSLPNQENKESENDHSPTSDFVHQDSHTSISTQDSENLLNPESEHPLSSRLSKHPESSLQQREHSLQSDNFSSCLLCGCSFVNSSQEYADNWACSCDIELSRDSSSPGKLDNLFSHRAYIKDTNIKPQNTLKPKDLIGIPWMVAFALRSSGWYLRQDIIWNKPNPMHESVGDRCTKSHEYIFLLTKSAKYYYDADAIKTPIKDESFHRMNRGVSDSHKNINGAPGQTPHTLSQPRPNKKMSRNPREGVDIKGGNQASKAGIKAYTHRGDGDQKLTGHSGNYDNEGNMIGDGMANKKSVWTVTTKPYSGAHFATFPEALIVDCIKAGCPVGGCVLDPFMGAGTTALVASKLGRNYIGFELNLKYIKIAERRLHQHLGFFNQHQPS